MQRQKLFEVK